MKLLRYPIAAAAITTLLGSVSFAGTEGMPSMPLIKEKRIFTVTANDDLRAEQGFGDQAPMVKMMNLMMVEGSGMQGMDMDMNQKVAANEKSPKVDTKMAEAPQTAGSVGAYNAELKSSPNANVGTNAVQFTVVDTKSNKPSKGLKLKSQVSMTSMNMGTETPAVKEKSSGLYEVKAGFAMKGPWAIKIEFPDKSEKIFNFQAGGSK